MVFIPQIVQGAYRTENSWLNVILAKNIFIAIAIISIASSSHRTIILEFGDTMLYIVKYVTLSEIHKTLKYINYAYGFNWLNM